jgi:hypothetical protein
VGDGVYVGRDIESVREARRRWYAANKDRQSPQSVANKAKYVERNVKIVLEAKDRPCMDCRVQYIPPVMEFDHREGEKKTGNVSKLARTPVSVAKLLDEISKCDVVCANCHRVRTASRGGWEWMLD